MEPRLLARPLGIGGPNCLLSPCLASPQAAQHVWKGCGRSIPAPEANRIRHAVLGSEGGVVSSSGGGRISCRGRGERRRCRSDEGPPGTCTAARRRHVDSRQGSEAPLLVHRCSHSLVSGELSRMGASCMHELVRVYTRGCAHDPRSFAPIHTCVIVYVFTSACVVALHTPQLASHRSRVCNRPTIGGCCAAVVPLDGLAAGVRAVQ